MGSMRGCSGEMSAQPALSPSLSCLSPSLYFKDKQKRKNKKDVEEDNMKASGFTRE